MLVMLECNLEWFDFVGSGLDNFLGIYVFYLSWIYYWIYGIYDECKIGCRLFNGCIGFYNEYIVELFEMVKVGM